MNSWNCGQTKQDERVEKYMTASNMTSAGSASIKTGLIFGCLFGAFGLVVWFIAFCVDHQTAIAAFAG